MGYGIGDEALEENDVADEIDVEDVKRIEEHTNRKRNLIYDMYDLRDMIGS